MARETTLIISVKDKFSPAITSIRNSGKHFNKDLEEMQQKIIALEGRQASLGAGLSKSQTRLVETSNALKTAKKEFSALNDETRRMNLDKANEAYNLAKQEVTEWGAAIKETRKEIRELADESNRSQNRAEAGGGLAQSLAGAGMGKMLGDSLSGAANVAIGSAFGDVAGSAISTALSGAFTGAAMGSIVPGIGTAVGAAVGLVSGGVSALAQNYAKEDEAFKGVVQDMYSTIKQEEAGNLTAGSGIAAQRETSLISFSTLFKDADKAKAYLDDMRGMANTTPFLYGDLEQMSKTLLTYGYSDDQLLSQLTTIGDTGAALGMTAPDMSMVATGLGRMFNSDKATLEYLNLLIERGIPAIDYLAQDSGKSIKEVYEGISKGEISGKEAAAVISHYLGEAYAGSMEMQSKTFAGMTSTLEGLNQELQAAMGDGYNETRSKGIEDKISYLSSASGESMKEANRLIGEYQASLENAKWEAERDAIEAVMGSDEYLKAKAEEDGATMGALLAQAKVDAETAYIESEAYKQYEETELGIVHRLQATLSPAWEHFGYTMSQAFSRGRYSIDKDLVSAFSPEGGVYQAPGLQGTAALDYNPLAGYAVGLPYVPRDDFPARLHEGERVLTAEENRRYSSGAGSINIAKLTDTVVVREEADIERIARQLATELRRAQQIS